MRLTILPIIALACPVVALADGRQDYQNALDAALLEYTSERPIGSQAYYDIDGLRKDGTMIRYDENDAPNVVTPELLAIYEAAEKRCIWAFDSDVYPLLPRTASLAVRSAAVDWPDEATMPIITEGDNCSERTYLATLIGDLDRVYTIKLQNRWIYLGFPSTGAPQ